MIDAGVDGLWVWDDLGYKAGPFISPKIYNTIIAPAHKKISSVFRGRGLPVIFHTDGDVRKLIPEFIKAGITALHP